MNRNVTVTIFELIGTALAGAVAMYMLQWARELMRAFVRDRDVAPADSTPESQPVPEPVVDPQPAAVEVVVMHREPDLLPAAPPRLEEVPFFYQTPVRLPAANSIDWKFAWEKVTDPHMTGSFPEIQLEMEDDSVVPPKQLPGFEVDGPRGRFNGTHTGAALDEAADLLPKKRTRKPLVDLDAGKVYLS